MITLSAMILSIVIPFYNEEKRLNHGKNLIENITYICSSLKHSVEFVLVDDGSLDNTVKILDKVKETLNKNHISIVKYAPNRGKGYAVKQGVLNCKGKKIITMDADFSIDITEIPRFMEILDSYDVAVGSKKHMLTKTRKKQKIPRRILGKGYTLITNWFMGLNFTDITCGFKAFKSDAAKNIFSRQSINRWAYDSETLFVAKKLKYSIKELPVSWYHVEGSKVNPITDTGKSFRDLLIILLNNYRGKYN